jgi:hypothetical protein
MSSNGQRCRSCTHRAANRPGGLCGPCFSDPVLRAKYPGKRRGGTNGDEDYTTRPPAPATAFRPGSVEKMLAMAERVRERRPACSPGDPDHERGTGRLVGELEAAERRAFLAGEMIGE